MGAAPEDSSGEPMARPLSGHEAVTVDAPSQPALVACGHGTRTPAGRRAVAQIRLDVAALRPGLEVVPASLDVQRPSLHDAVKDLRARGRHCVVVPLLLSAGYHLHTDVQAAVTASGGLARAARALGPDEGLVEVLAERLREADALPTDRVVLAAAGSTRARALADVRSTALALSRRWGAPVAAGYLSGARPGLAEAVARVRAEAPGARVAVAAYLLSPGHFTDRLGAVGADVVAGPLAPHAVLADLVLRRFDVVLRHFDLARGAWSPDSPAAVGPAGRSRPEPPQPPGVHRPDPW